MEYLGIWKWDLGPGTYGETRDPRSKILLLSEICDPRPGTLEA